MATVKNVESIQYCGFKIGSDEYAIPVMDVQEVIKPLPVTPVPLAQDVIRGLINLRGQIVTCISLRKLFGEEDDLSKPFMNIIIKGKEGLFSLVVDEVTDIIEVDPDERERKPETLPNQLKEFVDYVFKKEQGLVIILNAEKIISQKKTENVESIEPAPQANS